MKDEQETRGTEAPETEPATQEDTELETELFPVTAGDEADEPAADTSRVSGWRRVLRGNRTLWIVALCAVVSLVAGLLVGRFLIAPAAAAEAPKPGLVTVPVEFGPLSNDVTLRADVGYADAVDVKIDTSTGKSIVTGAVPEVGATLTPLSVALEVSGRPVIVLPGELPAYRTMRVGVSGPDVLQLKQALVAVGINPGDAGSNIFDEATAGAVGQLYAAVGYSAPASEEGTADAVRAAEETLSNAHSGVAQAESALAQAGSGPTALERWQADVRVAEAEKTLADAKAGVEGAPSVQKAEWDLQTAHLEREQLLAGKSTSSEQAAVDAAYAQVQSARQALASAQQKALPFLPAGEVLFLTELPRRVDDVKVSRGTEVTGPVMTVSGATVRLTGSAAEADARLLAVGAEASFELPDGTRHRAVISELTAGKDSKARWTVLLEPDPLTPEQISELRGTNVRVSIAVGATDGDVLSVPLAALTAGPGGESRVEVVESDPREGKDAKTRLVVVKTGLAAKGAVEVTPVEGTLDKGEQVVVGR